MPYSYFPAALPYLDALHDKDAWDKLLSELPTDAVTTPMDESPKDDVSTLNIAESHPFIEALDKMKDFMKGKDMTLTENGDPIHSTTHDACLDLYYNINACGQRQVDLLEMAWAEDRDLTLHIIFYARSIHRGKGLKVSFFSAFCWLLQKNPRTAILNLEMLVRGTIKSKQEKPKVDEDWDMVNEFKDNTTFNTKSHGCWKDLATLLTIYCQGELDGPEGYEYKATNWPRTEGLSISHKDKVSSEREKRWSARKAMDTEERLKDALRFIEMHKKMVSDMKAKAHEKRVTLRKERNDHVSSLMTNDKLYQALHSTIARLFSDQLVADMEQLEINKGKVQDGTSKGKYALSENISLAAKWAPTLKHSHDKHTFLATSIAEILFPPSKFQTESETRVQYLQKVRELYRKRYLAPLREALDLTERRMSAGKWDTIDYSHVPAICLKNNIGHFFTHAPEKVINFMKMVEKGKKKVAGSTLTPNQLVYKVFEPSIPKALQGIPGAEAAFAEMECSMVNGQWDSLLRSLRDIGQTEDGRVGLSESIAVCDVSGSMFSSYGAKNEEDWAIYAAIGLSLVISNLTKPPFNGHVISFTDIPSLLSPDTSLSFSEQVKVIQNSHVGYSTNLRAVFTDLLLPMAKKYNLNQEDMVKRIFVFSDMEFDSSYTGADKFLTTYESIKSEYKTAGYDMPELVWWNLANSSRQRILKAPVTKDNKGVCLLHGYSAAMLKTFLDGDLAQAHDMDTEEDEENEASMESVTETVDETDDELNPVDFMKKAVYHESFEGLKVCD